MNSDNYFNAVYDELKEYYNIIKENDIILIKNISLDERKKIYKILEDNYICLYKKSITNNSINTKDIIISTTELKNDVDNVFLHIMDLNKDLELSNENLKYLSYIFPNILNDYNNFKILFDKYFNDYNSYKNYEDKIINQILEYLNENIHKFKDFSIEKPKLLKSKKDLYNINNKSKDYTFYLRVDIIKANWTVVNRILNLNDNWDDLINKFNDYNIDLISKSKKIRQIIMGKLGINPKIMDHQNIIIKDIYDSIDNKNIIKLINNNKIIFELSKIDIYNNINYIQNIINFKYPSIFKIELFKLSIHNIKLNKEHTIYKEDIYDITDVSKIINYKLKAFEKKYIIDVIKKLQTLNIF